MSRPTSITKERILAAAIDLVRKGGVSVLTARSLSSALGCGVNAIFTKFGSMEGVVESVRTEARRLFKERVGAGFTLCPPFKGFGLALVWFAMDEPELFKLIMECRTPAMSFEAYIDTQIGFKEESLVAIGQSFGLYGKDAEMLYFQMILIGLGLARSCVDGGTLLHLQQVSEIFGKNVRAFLMVIRAGTDERESFIPQKDVGPDGDVDSYLPMHALAGQNHLLRELHANPRYVQNSEWIEMERVFRNSFSLSPETLRETYPNLTRGDVHIFILSHLHFSVAEQALLLGISPASVTKARQRLKGKMVQ